MRSDSRYQSPILILRPHPWTYHPLSPQQRLRDCIDGTDPADHPEARGRRSAPRGRTADGPIASLTARLARWLGLG
jgi:hypothetical protein